MKRDISQNGILMNLNKISRVREMRELVHKCNKKRIMLIR